MFISIKCVSQILPPAPHPPLNFSCLQKIGKCLGGTLMHVDDVEKIAVSCLQNPSVQINVKPARCELLHWPTHHFSHPTLKTVDSKSIWFYWKWFHYLKRIFEELQKFNFAPSDLSKDILGWKKRENLAVNSGSIWLRRPSQHRRKGLRSSLCGAQISTKIIWKKFAP
jgi:hypothetical protein